MIIRPQQSGKAKLLILLIHFDFMIITLLPFDWNQVNICI